MEPSYDMSETIVLPFNNDLPPTPLQQQRRSRRAQEAHEKDIENQRKAMSNKSSLREQCCKEIVEAEKLLCSKGDRLQEIFRTFDYSKVISDMRDRQKMIQLARERADIMEKEYLMLEKLKKGYENAFGVKETSGAFVANKKLPDNTWQTMHCQQMMNLFPVMAANQPICELFWQDTSVLVADGNCLRYVPHQMTNDIPTGETNWKNKVPEWLNNLKPLGGVSRENVSHTESILMRKPQENSNEPLMKRAKTTSKHE